MSSEAFAGAETTFAFAMKSDSSVLFLTIFGFLALVAVTSAATGVAMSAPAVAAPSHARGGKGV